MNKRICAIHQPNFFPWLGYFNKIKQCDEFILLDAVDYPKCSSGTWCNRVKIAIQDRAAWVGCPLQSFSGVKKIREVQIHNSESWRQKLLKTIDINYRKTLNFNRVFEFLESLIQYQTDNLADFNYHALKGICNFLGIEHKFRFQSELKVIGRSTQLLINLTKEVGCNVYLCGNGSSGYQQDELFDEQGISLQYQNFVPSVYGLEEKFIPGLSIIDFLMKTQDFNI